MKYYSEVKKILIDNEINRFVKNYSANKKELDTYYEVGKLLCESRKKSTLVNEALFKEYAKKLSNSLYEKYSYEELKYMHSFYLGIKGGMELNYRLTWFNYKEIHNI